MTNEKQRVHCSNEKFLEAVYSSKTYAEVAKKTGQKVLPQWQDILEQRKHYLNRI